MMIKAIMELIEIVDKLELEKGRLTEENFQLRDALVRIRDMPDAVYKGITADGEGPAHTVTPPNPRVMQTIARNALEGGEV